MFSNATILIFFDFEFYFFSHFSFFTKVYFHFGKQQKFIDFSAPNRTIFLSIANIETENYAAIQSELSYL
jgi:hypothetical protein